MATKERPCQGRRNDYMSREMRIRPPSGAGADSGRMRVLVVGATRHYHKRSRTVRLFSGTKRLPCRNWDLRNLRTTNDTVMRRLITRTRLRLPIRAHDILSRCCSPSRHTGTSDERPHAAVSGVGEPRERQAFRKGFAPWCHKAFSSRASEAG